MIIVILSCFVRVSVHKLSYHILLYPLTFLLHLIASTLHLSLFTSCFFFFVLVVILSVRLDDAAMKEL